MEKKTKHKKQQVTTRPISEREHDQNIVLIPVGTEILKFDATPRKLRITSHIGETSDISIDKKDMYID